MWLPGGSRICFSAENFRLFYEISAPKIVLKICFSPLFAKEKARTLVNTAH